MIKAMSFADLEAIEAIEKELFSSGWSLEDFAKELKATDLAKIFVLWLDDEIIGFVSLREILERGEITNLAVKSSYQSKGYGRKLLRFALDTMSNDGMEAAFLEVRVSNLKALELYKSEGFIIMRKRKSYYSDNYEDAYEMAVPLGGNV